MCAGKRAHMGEPGAAAGAWMALGAELARHARDRQQEHKRPNIHCGRGCCTMPLIVSLSSSSSNCPSSKNSVRMSLREKTRVTYTTMTNNGSKEKMANSSPKMSFSAYTTCVRVNGRNKVVMLAVVKCMWAGTLGTGLCNAARSKKPKQSEICRRCQPGQHPSTVCRARAP